MALHNFFELEKRKRKPEWEHKRECIWQCEEEFVKHSDAVAALTIYVEVPRIHTEYTYFWMEQLGAFQIGNICG